ncbi:S-layer homology domain-containing protein [Thermoanaerobacter uzonensis DSM 18761]|uniref:S-layer homology domain-containing protein n=1 Tax=Thermoanaerobacter uzonensis DSM 18761 TaxID=1123369 RepID=A0A1M4XA06_9THEO|nr:S-layer homology domain-containing protein [Thermoanaerobacter uzonensis]SHE90256.1 S-layer homology domain-containing protein [Thermoanaerobacter uzonensis DSM 18761]
MKNLKKLIAVVLTFALVFSAMAVGFAATTPFTDVKDDAPYASAVARLYALNITNGNTDGTYGVDQPVTRAMMTVFINRLSGYRDLAEMAKNDPPAFKDVPKNYWAIGDINLAAKLGLTHGVGNGMFDPEGKVTYAQALGFLLNALGYKNLSWPYGVVAQAQEIGLTSGVSLGYNDVINRGNLAILMNNALDLNLVTYDTNGNVVDTGKALISKLGSSANYLVVATNNVDSTVPAGYVAVKPANLNYGVYNFGAQQYISSGLVDFNKYLGEVVTVISDKSGNPIAATPLTTDIKTFTVTADPGVTVSGATYTFGDNSISVGNIPVVIDGIKTTLSAVYQNIDPGSKVTLINNDNATGYDYAIITDATGNWDQMIVVQNDVKAGDSYIDNRIAINDSNGNPYPVQGAVTKATDIKAGDVVYQVKIAGNTILYVVRQTVTGTVTQLTQATDGTKTVTINGTNYTLYKGTTIPGGSDLSSVTAGSSGTAIVAKNNTIVKWTATSTTATTKYAVVKYNTSFTWNNPIVSLALPDGSSTVLNVVYDNIPSSIPASVKAGDIVNYTVNSNGLIDTMSVVTNTVANDAYAYVDTTNNIIKFANDSASATNGAIYYVNSSTVFFNATISNGQVTGITPVKFTDVANGSTHNVLLATATGVRQLSVVVFNDPNLTANTSVQPMVYVTSVSTVYTSSTTSYTSLSVLENGVAKTYNAPAGTTLNVTAGNVYTLTLNASGNVTAATLVGPAYSGTVSFDYANNAIVANGTSYLLDPNVVVIDSATNTQVGLSSIVAGSTTVKLYTNSTTGKVVLIVK